MLEADQQFSWQILESSTLRFRTLKKSSNVLHYTALLQKCLIDVVHHYSYPSVQFVENYTLAQFDETICFFQIDGKCAFNFMEINHRLLRSTYG